MKNQLQKLAPVLSFYSEYKKTVMAAAGALGVTLSAVSDGHIDGGEWAAVLSAWGAVLAVYQARNIPPKKAPK